MTDKTEKKKMPFIKGFIIYIVILAALVALALGALYIGLSKLNEKLAPSPDPGDQDEYAEVKTVSKIDVFNEFFSGTDSGYWADRWFESHPRSLDSRDAVEKVMEGLFFSEKAEVFRSAKNTNAYVIKNGNRRIAEVFLDSSEKDGWVVSGVVLLIEGEYQKEIAAPESCSVFCNGSALGEEYIVSETDALMPIEQYADDLADPVHICTWRVSGLLCEPEMRVEGIQGEKLIEIGDSEYAYVAPEAFEEKYADKVGLFADRVICFFMKGHRVTNYNARRALNYVKAKSQAEEVILEMVRGVYLGAFYTYSQTITCSDFIKISDNCYRIDVEYYLTDIVNIDAKNGVKLEDSSGTLHIYLVDFGKGYEICGLQVE